MTRLPEPILAIIERYEWARQPLVRSVEAFGADAVSKVAVALERRGALSRIEGRASSQFASMLGEEMLSGEPEMFSKRESIFEPKAQPPSGQAKPAAAE